MSRGVSWNEFPDSKVRKMLKCEKCDFVTMNKKWLKDHRQKVHAY